MSSKTSGVALWHVPQTLPIANNGIQLGTILENPYDVSSQVNRGQLVPVDKDDEILLANEFSKNLFQSLSQDTNLTIMATTWIASVLNLDSAAQAGKQHQDLRKINASNVSAKCFNPSKKYMDDCLAKSLVQEWIERKRWRQNLYVITGVAIADMVSKEDIHESGGGSKGLVSGSTVGEVPVGAQVAVSAERSGTEMHASNTLIKVPCVLSYRVRRFMYNKITKHTKDKGNVVTGALYGLDGKLSVVEQAYVPEFEAFVVDKSKRPNDDAIVVKVEI